MAPSFSQSATPVSGTSSPTTVSFASATGSGQLVVVTISNDSGGLLSTGVSDNLGNTYTRALSGGAQTLEIWFSVLTTGSATHTVSVAWSTASIGRTTVAAQVFAGFTGNTPLDTIASSTGTSTTASSGTTGTPSTSSSLVVAAASGSAATGAAMLLGPPLTYGLASAGSLTDSGASNYLNASKITTVGGGYASAISVYVGATIGTSPADQFQCAIYADSGGVPGTLIGVTSPGTLVANSLNSLPIDVQLAPATSYWLVYNTNGTNSSQNNLKYNNGGTSVSSSASTSFGTWPSPFGSTSAAAVTFSIFITYTEYGNLSTLGASGSSVGMASKTTTATTAQTGTMTLTTSQLWRAGAVVFKEVSSSGGGANVAVTTGTFLVL